MKHSGMLSIIVFSLGYLTGISLLFEPALYLKLMGASIIGYLSFILVLQQERREDEEGEEYE
jgi:hypothetical protein